MFVHMNENDRTLFDTEFIFENTHTFEYYELSTWYILCYPSLCTYVHKYVTFYTTSNILFRIISVPDFCFPSELHKRIKKQLNPATVLIIMRTHTLRIISSFPYCTCYPCSSKWRKLLQHQHQMCKARDRNYTLKALYYQTMESLNHNEDKAYFYVRRVLQLNLICHSSN